MSLFEEFLDDDEGDDDEDQEEEENEEKGKDKSETPPNEGPLVKIEKLQLKIRELSKEYNREKAARELDQQKILLLEQQLVEAKEALSSARASTQKEPQSSAKAEAASQS